MATARQFEDLSVWQEARSLVGAVYSAPKARAFEFSALRESATTFSKKLSVFIRYLDGYADNARVKKATRAHMDNLQLSTSNQQPA